jgi:2-phosphoglycerate kinase
MIYILTGMAKTGKSILAKELSKQTGFSIIPTDYLMMMFHKTNKTLGVDADDSDPSVSKALEPYLLSLIETMIENKDDYIIEGVHFLPLFARKLIDRYPNDIKMLYLGYKDWTPVQKMEDLILHKKNTKNCWYGHYNSQELLKLSEYLVKESIKLYHEVIKLDLHYIEVTHIMDQIPKIIDDLLKK